MANIIRDIGVEVTQVLVEAAPQVATPELMQVVTGVNRQVLSDHVAGKYANVAVDMPLTELMATSILDPTSVGVAVLNELGKFTVPVGLTTTLKNFAVDSTNTGVNLPAFLRVNRTSQAISTTGALAVTASTIKQALILSAAVGVTPAGAGGTINVDTAVFTSVAVGDVLELTDTNPSHGGGTRVRRFHASAVGAGNVFTTDNLNPDGLGALEAGTHTNIRAYLPVYTFTDVNGLFLYNRTRPVDDALPTGSKQYPQAGDDMGDPTTWGGLYAFVEYKPMVGSPQTWKIKTWNSDVSLILEPLPPTTNPVSTYPSVVDLTGVRYDVLTEEPAVGRVPSGQADVYQSYKAKRTDLVARWAKVQGTEDCATVFGPPVADNPLGLGMWLACAINTTTQVMGMAVIDDTPAAHSDALSAMTLLDEPYYLTPLTARTDVVTLYESHVLQMSAPENRRERVTAIHLPILTRKIYQEFSSPVTISIASTNHVTVPGAQFLTHMVRPGDKLEMVDPDCTAPTATRQFTFNHIIDEDTVEIQNMNPDGYGALVATSPKTSVKIVTPTYNADQKVQAISEAAIAISERRVALVEPGEVTLSPSGVDILVDGSYLSVAICAMYSINEPGKPLSLMDIPGVMAVSGSNDTFTNIQLRSMTSSGIMVVIQSNPSAPPVIRHEVCTDVSSKKVQQWSFTHVIDSLAKALRIALNPLLGKDRITEEFLNKIYVTVFSVFSYYKDGKHRISDFDIQELGVSATIEDAIAIRVKVSIPNVANNADVTLLI